MKGGTDTLQARSLPRCQRQYRRIDIDYKTPEKFQNKNPENLGYAENHTTIIRISDPVSDEIKFNQH